jgi:hypothetical protein
VKLRKHLGWANAVLLALLLKSEKTYHDSKRRTAGVLFRACRLPVQNLRKPRGGKRLLTLSYRYGWQTYAHERFGHDDLQTAVRLGYVSAAPNDRAEPKPEDQWFSWGKQAAVRLSLTELGRAAFAAYVLGRSTPHPETYSP